MCVLRRVCQRCAAAVNAELDVRGVQFGDIDCPNGCVSVTLRDIESGFSEGEAQDVVLLCGDGEDGQLSLVV